MADPQPKAPEAPPEPTQQLSALVPKTPTTTIAQANAAGYLGVPTDTADDYVYTLKGVSGVPKP